MEQESVNDGSIQGASFINKPARGWLHTDTQLSDGGVKYGVKYIGCLEVHTSMKSLNFDTRSVIAKECINRVCESARLITERRRRVAHTIGRILGEEPLMQHSGSDINLTISSTSLTLVSLDNQIVIAHHDMPNISFASGGDQDTLDFIAYVAKDVRYGRACFVLKCGKDQAQNVITSIGQAFELRFKEYLKKTPQGQMGMNSTLPNASLMSHQQQTVYSTVKTERGGPGNPSDDPEYYNDLPGKVPPDLVSSESSQSFNSTNTQQQQVPTIPPLPAYSAPTSSSATTASHRRNAPNNFSSLKSDDNPHASSRLNGDHHHQLPASPGASNLIDLNSESLPLRSEPEYANDAVMKRQTDAGKDSSSDIFDMTPFNSVNTLDTSTRPKCLSVQQQKQLAQEQWYHGPITRKQAEELLKNDGDFLVRECQSTAGQYVLTGVQNNTKKHLLLVDPNGVVRTKHQTFSSVSHLINYHRDNELPIVSAESALVLRTPVMRQSASHVR